MHRESKGADAIERKTAEYTPCYRRFLVKTKNYSRQYSHIYHKRFLQLRPAVMRALKSGEGKGARAAVLRRCAAPTARHDDAQTSGSPARSSTSTRAMSGSWWAPCTRR